MKHGDLQQRLWGLSVPAGAVAVLLLLLTLHVQALLHPGFDVLQPAALINLLQKWGAYVQSAPPKGGGGETGGWWADGEECAHEREGGVKVVAVRRKGGKEGGASVVQ